MVSAVDDSCNLYLWKHFKDLELNVGQNFSGHASIIERVEFTEEDKFLLSLGQSDRSLFQWKIE